MKGQLMTDEEIAAQLAARRARYLAWRSGNRDYTAWTGGVPNPGAPTRPPVIVTPPSNASNNPPVVSPPVTGEVALTLKEIMRILAAGGTITNTGIKGDPGPQGVEGPMGPAGPQGNTGVQGEAGNDSDVPGPQGPKGDTGDQGIQGPSGPQGSPGIKGDTGSQGPQGIAGEKGSQGPKGDTGLTGPQGIQGLTGNTGATGPQGIKGDTGATGPQGVKGDTGAQGIQGVKGDTGSQGPAGASATVQEEVGIINVPALLLGGNTTVVVPLSGSFPDNNYLVKIRFFAGVNLLSMLSGQVMSKTVNSVTIKITASGLASAAGIMLVDCYRSGS